MISRCHRFFIHVWLRYRGVVQVSFVLAVIAGYCLVLGNYAVTNLDQTNKPRAGPIDDENQRTTQEDFEEMTFAPTHTTAQSLALTTAPPLEVELEERRRLVTNVCAKYALASRGEPNAWEFFVDEKRNLVWCNIFKAASSTWMYYFNLLGGYKDQYLRRTNKAPLILARARFPRPTVVQLHAALPRSLSFLVVREPFERLLSAFRNKLENFRHRFYRKMALEMIAKYRTTPERRRAASPTFSEFVSFVVEKAGNKKPHFDEHWAPYNAFCTPCHVNFTVIAKLETLERDQEYIIKVAQLDDVLIPDLRRRNPKSAVNQAKDGRSTKSLVESYYGQLSLEQVTRLYEIYKIDFEMFGYNATKYFNMARKSDL